MSAEFSTGYISGMNIGMAILGGLLISASTSMNLLLKGRITGMSGIFYSLITLDKSSFYWKTSIVSGMLFAVSILYLAAGVDPIYSKINGGKNSYIRQNTYLFEPANFQVGNLNFGGFAIAGLLVGIGTKLGNGCTSGHGVCGMPRLAIRSWTAVGTFMGSGIAMANIFYHLDIWNTYQAPDVIQGTNYTANSIAILVLSILCVGYVYFTQPDKQDTLISFFVGVLFALGLGFGGMLQRSKI